MADMWVNVHGDDGGMVNLSLIHAVYLVNQTWWKERWSVTAANGVMNSYSLFVGSKADCEAYLAALRTRCRQ